MFGGISGRAARAAARPHRPGRAWRAGTLEVITPTQAPPRGRGATGRMTGVVAIRAVARSALRLS